MRAQVVSFATIATARPLSLCSGRSCSTLSLAQLLSVNIMLLAITSTTALPKTSRGVNCDRVPVVVSATGILRPQCLMGRETTSGTRGTW